MIDRFAIVILCTFAIAINMTVVFPIAWYIFTGKNSMKWVEWIYTNLDPDQ